MSIYGIWFGGRRTAIVVSADSRSSAISKARAKKKRGGNNVETARVLKPNEAKVARRGDWLRTGAKGQSAGYKGKRGFGPKLKKR